MRLQSFSLKVSALQRCRVRCDNRRCPPFGLRAASSSGRLNAGLKEGIDEDELLARQIGLSDAGQMSTTQEKYKERIKEKLLEVHISCSTLQICSLDNGLQWVWWQVWCSSWTCSALY